jgi:putative phosphoesterase
MRIAALADIHGNLPALEAVLADLEREEVDRVVVAGDTIPGPWPIEVLGTVLRLDPAIVHGNAERHVLTREDRLGPLAPWCADQLGADRLRIVAGWPTTLELEVDGLGKVLVCHATPTSDEPIYTYLTPEDTLLELLGDVEADVVLCGHTHMQYDRTLSTGLRIVNPGSVGMPYQGEPGAYWALLGPDVEHRRSEYDVVSAVRAALALDAPVGEERLSQLVEPPSADEAAAYFESVRENEGGA